MRKRWLLAIALSVIAASVMVTAQTNPWYRPMNPFGQSLGVGYGTVTPTVANWGAAPANGELFIDMDAAPSDGGPQLLIYSDASTAWTSMSAGGLGAGETIVFEGATADANETTLTVEDPTADNTITLPDDTGTVLTSTLATNGQGVANSIWGGTNQLIFETTATNFEAIVTAAVQALADTTYTLPADNAQWAGAGTFMVSNFATNAPDVANAVWGEANSLHFEGATGAADANEHGIQSGDATVGDQNFILPDNAAADSYAFMFSILDTNAREIANSIWFDTDVMIYEGTLDAFETTLSIVDPIVDRTLSLNGATGDTIVTTRDGQGGYYGGAGYPNPWRQDFRLDGFANAVCQLDDMSAVCTVADTNVGNMALGNSTMEYWAEQTNAGGLAAMFTPNADGWLIELDDAADDGIQGMFFGADDDFDVGFGCVALTDACYMEASIIITDSSEIDQVLFGWLVRENYAADGEEDGYNTYALVGVDDLVADPRSIVIAEEVNADGGANTDTLVDVVDGTAFIVRTILQVDGTVDVWVNGAETNNNVGGAAWDAADFAVPYYSVICSAGDATPDPDVIIQWVEVGYLN